MGQVILMEPGNCYRLIEIGGELSLEAVQKYVDGVPEVALRVPSQFFGNLIKDCTSKLNTILFCDKGGSSKDLPITYVRSTDGRLIVGPVLIASYTTNAWRDDNYYPLQRDQLHDIVSYLRKNGWSELMIDDLDYTKEFIMDGGKVAEA